MKIFLTPNTKEKFIIHHIGTTAPSTVWQGQLWLDTNTTPATLKYYNGTTWVDVRVQYSVQTGSHTHTEADLSLSDVTTNNVTTSRHGFCPKLSGNSTHFLSGDGSWAVPSVGQASNPWDGRIVGAYADGDPNLLLALMQNAGVVSPTPTNISTSVARVSFFRLPASITVNTIRFYGVGATTNVYRVAIYRASDGARLTNELPITTTANAWGSVSAGGVTLQANVLYFIAVAVNATGTTAGVLAFGPTVAATTGQIQVVPTSFPGNLNLSSGYVSAGLAQFAVTSGALPNPAPTLAAQGAWTGGMPAFFLDNA